MGAGKERDQRFQKYLSASERLFAANRKNYETGQHKYRAKRDGSDERREKIQAEVIVYKRSALYSLCAVDAALNSEHDDEQRADVNKGSDEVLIGDPVVDSLFGVLEINLEWVDKLLSE